MTYWREHPAADGAGRDDGPDVLDGTADGAQEWVDRWAARAEETIAETQELARRVAEVTATASSARGEVEVTVGAAGQLTGLRLAAEVGRWHPDEIAAEVLRLAGAARDRLADAVAAAVDTVGVDPDTARAVVDSYIGRAAVPSSPDLAGGGRAPRW